MEARVVSGAPLNTLSRDALEAEILRLRTAEAALRAGEARFRTILETVDAAFAIVEVKFDVDETPIDYRFVEANPAFEREAGVNLRGKWVTEIRPGLGAVLVRDLRPRRQDPGADDLRELRQGVRPLVRRAGRPGRRP